MGGGNETTSDGTDTRTISLLAVQEHGANLQALLLDSSDDEPGFDGAEDAVSPARASAAPRATGAKDTAAQEHGGPGEATAAESIGQSREGGADAVDVTTTDGCSVRLPRLEPSTIAEQVKLLTGQWMVEGTMHSKICKYGISLFVRDIVHGIVDGAFQALDDQDRARRELRVRWVRLSRELCRIDGLLNPPSRLPGALEARVAARKERLQQEEARRPRHGSDSAEPSGKQKPRARSGETHELRPLFPSAFESGTDRSRSKNRDPPGNSQRRAEEKQMKIMAQYLQNCDVLKEDALLVSSPDLQHRPWVQDSGPTMPKRTAQELLPRVPKVLDSVVSTYMRGSGRPAKNKRRQRTHALPPRATSMQDRHKNTSVLEPAHSMQHPQELLGPDLGQTVRLPRLSSNKENRRCASAEPASRMHDIPCITKRLQRGSGIFKPTLAGPQKEMPSGNIPRSCGVPSGVSICPVSDLATQQVGDSDVYLPDFE
eukprot:Tamp_08430.p1 GENE.Tamp_08430~~Tamp_08430.p1  ORF type:complete len:503 (+),score=56.16 Tamp_08430:54-1511(+)